MIGELSTQAGRAESPTTIGYRGLWWVLVLGLYISLAFQGGRGLWSPDEGRYVDAALQMLDSGNYLAPAYSPAEPNFSKPPLTYWVIAASIKALGRNTWAVRAPYALAYVGTLALLFFMGRRVSPSKPWLASLIYATSAFTYLTANIISTDVLLTFFEAIAVLGFITATWPTSETARSYAPIILWLGCGLAFLTKGPPGLLPLLAMLAFALVAREKRALRALGHPVGLLVFAVVGLTWYVMAALRYPWLIHYFLHDEVYGRIFTAMHRRHPGAMGWALVYAPVLIFGSLPWWSGLTQALSAPFRRSFWRNSQAMRTTQGFLLFWFALPLVIFCLSQSRLPLYLLPLFLPLSLLTASRLEFTFDPGSRRTRALLAGWIIVLLAIKGYAAYGIDSKVDNRRAASEIAAATADSGYSSLVFLELNDDAYSVEEQTPWGIRLYLNKPVYGVSARSAQVGSQLCDAIKTSGTSLVVVDPNLSDADLDASTQDCHPTLRPLGPWRGNALVLAHL